MQVRYSATATSAPSRPAQWVGISALVVVLLLWSRHSPFPAIMVAAVIGFFFLATVNGLHQNRTAERRERADDGRLLFDFQDAFFLCYRSVGEPPETICYAEILTYYVERGREDEYDRPRTFLTIQFRNRPAIAFDVKHLDLDPQRIVGFIEGKMKWVYAQQPK